MFCALLKSRYQVSVYRTNGPLVFFWPYLLHICFHPHEGSLTVKCAFFGIVNNLVTFDTRGGEQSKPLTVSLKNGFS